MTQAKIVVVEDEADILEVMEYNLRREGFRVLSARDGEEGLELVRREAPAMVLLDLMLPGIDGVELCRRLKGDSVTRGISIIMVTAKGEESDVVLGLGVGADDYVIKPFSPRELMARVHAVLRRQGPADVRTDSDRIVLPGVVIDPDRHEVFVNDESVPFTATQFRLLHFLASHPGRVFTRAQLLSRVIAEGAIVSDRNIDVHLKAIRKKLGPHRDLIDTIRGVGYRFRDDPGSGTDGS